MFEKRGRSRTSRFNHSARKMTTTVTDWESFDQPDNETATKDKRNKNFERFSDQCGQPSIRCFRCMKEEKIQKKKKKLEQK